MTLDHLPPPKGTETLHDSPSLSPVPDDFDEVPAAKNKKGRAAESRKGKGKAVDVDDEEEKFTVTLKKKGGRGRARAVASDAEEDEVIRPSKKAATATKKDKGKGKSKENQPDEERGTKSSSQQSKDETPLRAMVSFKTILQQFRQLTGRFYVCRRMFPTAPLQSSSKTNLSKRLRLPPRTSRLNQLLRPHLCQPNPHRPPHLMPPCLAATPSADNQSQPRCQKSSDEPLLNPRLLSQRPSRITHPSQRLRSRPSRILCRCIRRDRTRRRRHPGCRRRRSRRRSCRGRRLGSWNLQMRSKGGRT